MTDYRTQRHDDVVTHNERAAFPGLTVVDLRHAAGAVTQPYQNFVGFEVNDHCLRLAVMQGQFRWHRHPRSDECFVVLEGELEVDLADGRTLCLKAGQACTIPADVIHRTRAHVRTVNLCFEHRRAYTDVVFEDGQTGGSR